MTKSTNKAWTPELTAALVASVSAFSQPFTAEAVSAAVEATGNSDRSVASKLRKMGYEVGSVAKSSVPVFNSEDSAALDAFVTQREGQLTYKEIAETFAQGKYTAKQIQGKLLAMELSGLAKPAEKLEAVRVYSDAETATFVAMAKAGKFLEEIAEALNKKIESVRGKALSLHRAGELDKIPTQRDHKVAGESEDSIAALGSKLAEMSVAEIAAATDKTERGVKIILTRRGINCADYKGQTKREKADAKTTEAA